MVGMVLVIMWGMSAAGAASQRITAKTRASDFIPVKCDEHRESRWCVVEKGGEFSPWSTTEALRRRTVSLLDVGLRHCGLVHRERRTRRDSIKREAFFITGSPADSCWCVTVPSRGRH